jgi:hypothetical protein
MLNLAVSKGSPYECPHSDGYPLETRHSDGVPIETEIEAEEIVLVAASLGTDLTLQNAMQAVFQEGSRRGFDEHDLSALVNVFDSGQ